MSLLSFKTQEAKFFSLDFHDWFLSMDVKYVYIKYKHKIFDIRIKLRTSL